MCSVVVGNQRFGGSCCLYLHGEVIWRQHVLLKRSYPTTTLHGVTNLHRREKPQNSRRGNDDNFCYLNITETKYTVASVVVEAMQNHSEAHSMSSWYCRLLHCKTQSYKEHTGNMLIATKECVLLRNHYHLESTCSRYTRIHSSGIEEGGGR